MADVEHIGRLISAVGVPTAVLLFTAFVFYRHGLPMARDLVNAHKGYLDETSKRVEKIDHIDHKVDRLLAGDGCRQRFIEGGQNARL